MEVEELLGKKPEALVNMPQVTRVQAWYLSVFRQLSAWRGTSGLGQLSPISVTDLLSYCEYFGIKSPTLREDLFKHIKTLDITYLLAKMKRDPEDG